MGTDSAKMGKQWSSSFETLSLKEVQEKSGRSPWKSISFSSPHRAYLFLHTAVLKPLEG
jgi:hypothetical protein